MREIIRVDIEELFPRHLCQEIAQDAAVLAQLYAPKKTGAGARSIYAVSGPGVIGLRAGNTYMYYQEFGIRPFLMTALEGKTIPMSDGHGGIRFRRVKGVGMRQITDRDPMTGRILPGNRPIKWRHPGIAPKKFMERALNEAIDKRLVELRAHIVPILMEKLVLSDDNSV